MDISRFSGMRWSEWFTTQNWQVTIYSEWISIRLQDGVDMNSTFILWLTTILTIAVSDRMNVEFVSTPSFNPVVMYSNNRNITFAC